LHTSTQPSSHWFQNMTIPFRLKFFVQFANTTTLQNNFKYYLEKYQRDHFSSNLPWIVSILGRVKNLWGGGGFSRRTPINKYKELNRNDCKSWSFQIFQNGELALIETNYYPFGFLSSIFHVNYELYQLSLFWNPNIWSCISFIKTRKRNYLGMPTIPTSFSYGRKRAQQIHKGILNKYWF